MLDSGFDGVSALAILSLGGHDRQLHLLCDGPRQEAPDAVRLPARRLHQHTARRICGPRQMRLSQLGVSFRHPNIRVTEDLRQLVQ